METVFLGVEAIGNCVIVSSAHGNQRWKCHPNDACLLTRGRILQGQPGFTTTSTLSRSFRRPTKRGNLIDFPRTAFEPRRSCLRTINSLSMNRQPNTAGNPQNAGGGAAYMSMPKQDMEYLCAGEYHGRQAGYTL